MGEFNEDFKIERDTRYEKQQDAAEFKRFLIMYLIDEERNNNINLDQNTNLKFIIDN